jgi:hypothetical protein
VQYKGSELNPLFYGEISSTHLFYDIFDKHHETAKAFVEYIFKIEAEDLLITREKFYPGKGSIDLFFDFQRQGRRLAILIEAKVHDYLSVSDHQISTYYNAVSDDQIYDQIFFIYLTQFNERDNFECTAQPKSLVEAERGRTLIGERFCHLTWLELHRFMEDHKNKLSPEQQLMLGLHKSWITDKCLSDLANNLVETGERNLTDYLVGVDDALENLHPFGRRMAEGSRVKLRIDLNNLNAAELDNVLEAITAFAASESVNRRKEYQTEEQTLTAAAGFLTELAANSEWLLLRFYAGLFRLARDTNHLRLFGTGTRGFSVKLEVLDKGEISLCTLYRNKTVEFSLIR